MKALRLVTVLPFLIGFSGCLGNSKFGALGMACPQLSGGGDPLTAHYSANVRANADVGAFVASSKDLVEVSMQIEGEAAEACRRMGRDLGVPEQQMHPSQDQAGGEAQAACGALRARIDGILQAGMGVQVSVRPPACTADVQAHAQCSGACNAQVDPGQVIAQCEPGRLSGHCSGTCQGSCDGSCQGQCDGQCSVRNASGQCAGRCSGTCHGSCDTTCHAQCQGQWQMPHCDAQIRAPQASAECQASCNARADIRAQCVPAQVMVQSTASTQDMARLAATLQANLPMLLHAELALGKRLVNTAEMMVSVGANLPNVIGQAGAEAAACVAAAANASATASARIHVSVQASASVSGRVGAGG